MSLVPSRRLSHAAARNSGQNLAPQDFAGALSEGVTPVPIPNTAVKPLSADGTYRVTGWESRPVPA